MIYDPELIEHIQSLPCERFDGQVFRTTGLKSDPTAFSTNGGRWAPPDGNNGGAPFFTRVWNEMARWLKLRLTYRCSHQFPKNHWHFIP